jgi:hypothetical protein
MDTDQREASREVEAISPYLLNYPIKNVLLLLHFGFTFSTLLDQLLVASLKIFVFLFCNLLLFHVLLSKTL